MESFNDRFIEILVDKEVSAERLSVTLDLSSSLISRWKKPNSTIMLSSALKLADYFEYSLDYLSGRSEDDSPFVGLECPPFGARLKQVLKKEKVSVYSIIKNTDFKRSHFDKWFHGSEPKLFSLITLANYLYMSIDDLVGRKNYLAKQF